MSYGLENYLSESEKKFGPASKNKHGNDTPTLTSNGASLKAIDDISSDENGIHKVGWHL